MSERFITGQSPEDYIDSRRIKMDEFNDLYGDNILNADRRRVDLLESRFDREDDPSAKKWAKKFEAMMSGCISDHMWFGGNAEMIHTCRFDDYINGIDGILHIKDLNRDSVIALGVDVTSARFEVLGAKFRRIVEELRSGRLAEIKYFRIEGFKGKKENIPRIILGAEHDTVENLYNNWLDGGSHLNKHWVQFQLLEMAIIQCRAFMEFARKNGFDLAGDIYGLELRKISSIYNTRKRFVGDVGDRDGIFRKIKQLCIDLNKDDE